MRLDFNDNVKLASAVLNTVQIPRDLRDDVDVKLYVNGREEGFCIRYFSDNEFADFRYIMFAEHRNSDDIVVYVDEDHGISPDNGMIPSDKAYDTAKFFRPSEAGIAGLFISETIARWKEQDSAASLRRESGPHRSGTKEVAQ